MPAHTPAGYSPALAYNPAAGERAVWYVGQYGSAAASLKVVDQPGHNDAFDREVCKELRQIRHLEREAARVAVVEKASLYLAVAA